MVIILKRRVEPRTPTLKSDWHLPLIVRVPIPPPVINDQRVAELLHMIGEDHGINPNLILGKRRELRIVAARHAWIAAVMREYNLSLSHGAKYLRLDRDTIRNALKMNLKREVEAELRKNGHIV